MSELSKVKMKKQHLIVLMGWGSIKESYNQFLKLTPPDWEVILLEPAELLDSSFNDPTKKLLSIVNEKQLIQFHLLGHSLGGAIAIQFAHKYPDRITQLYLINAEGVYEQINFLKSAVGYMLTGFYNFRQEASLFLKALIKVIPRPWYSLKLGQYAHNQDLINEASELKVQTTIIWGDRDLVIPPHQGQKLHQAIKGSKFILLKNCDHNWILNEPKYFWQQIM